MTDSILIQKRWPEFRILNEVYDERTIMFAYVGECKFHVRFFKQDSELAEINEQLNKKLQGLFAMIVREYQPTNGEGGIHAQFKQGNEIFAIFEMENQEMHMLTNFL